MRRAPFEQTTARSFVGAATVALLGLAALLGAHYAPFFGGDAVIHLSLMESSARGAWFEFNPGTPEASSSSILWTVLGAAWMRFGGGVAAGIYGIKAVCFLSWLALGVLSYGLARRLGADRRHALLGSAIAVALPGTAMNALQGMENGTFAAVVLAAVWVDSRPATRWRTAWVFWLAGVACALRPEGVVLLAVALASRWRTARRDAPVVLVATACTLLPCVAWYGHRTGHLIPSSGISRMMAARRDATSFRIGPLWVYCAPLLRLAVYAPLVAGAWVARRDSRTAALLVAGAVAFYALGTGCAQTSRYMIWVFALLSTLAAVGASRRPTYVPLALLWLLPVIAGEAYARLTQKLGVSDGNTTAELAGAPAQRRELTDATLASLGAGGCHPASPAVAVFEVQARFWLDDRLRVVSTDGVTGSADGQPAVYGIDGCPDLERVLEDRDVIGLLNNPVQGLERCGAGQNVRTMAAAWGEKDIPGWIWQGGMMVRSCSGTR